MEKKCSKCGEVKPCSEFHKNKSKKYGCHNECKKCTKAYYKEYYKANKNKVIAQQQEYYKANKNKKKEWGKAYYQDNKDKVYARKKLYRKNRIKTDPLFRLKCNISSRTSMAIKKQGYTKKSRTHEMLGIDYDRLVVYLERKFKKGMTWDNYGEWHIDHIIPLSSAKTEQELLKLCHYTNLQPLWAVDNMTKKNKIEETQILLRI